MGGDQTTFERAKAIFGEVQDLVDAAGRTAYLEEACEGHAALRAEVERLLAAAAEAGDFLGTPAVGPVPPAALEQPLAEGPGTVIGPYKLLEQIGEGGFGLVFVAEQLHPVRRQVGLKIIKPGMDTRQVIARFEAERQALALMDHPNIAQVFDAGATDSGRPYFVMELVRGVPVTQYCDEHHLTVRERLELFVMLCRAIEHAHQKGIIHRDVKPTNVLVAQRDGQAVPKVIDFGVAKALNQRLTERTVYTQVVQMIGTPLYMSPEQAEQSSLDVDTRSDIYSLGVVLYELLTGATPFDGERMEQAAVEEIRRIVREEDPLTPSARLSHSGERLATTAAQRRTEPAQLTKQVRGELDWIVMKCLEKDRDRRYETATALALDVQRYLTDEPVQACPPSALYRFGKFARRNKGALLAALLVVTSLLVGSAVATWQAIRARRAEQVAIAKSEQAASEAATATAISNLLLEMLESANPDAARGAEFTVRQMLDQFAGGLADQLHDQPEAEATIRLTIGDAYRRLGLLDQAEPQIEAALAQRQRTFGHDHVLVADALVKKAWLLNEQTDHVGAEALAREALAIDRNVGAGPKETIAALDVLFMAIWIQDSRADGRLAPVAQEIFDIAQQNPDGFPQVADLLHRLATSATARGDYVEAERLARRSVALHRKLQGDHHPETAWGLLELGHALSGQNKFAEAEASYDESLAIFRKHYQASHKPLLTLYSNLASALRAQGDEDELNELRAEAIAIDATDSPDWEWWEDLAGLHNDLGQSELATACYRQALALAPPKEIADLQLELGQTLADQGKFDEAETCYRAALALYREDAPNSNKAILSTYWHLGRMTWARGEEPGHTDLEATVREMDLGDEPDWECWSLRGTMLFLMGRSEEGAASLRKAIELAPPQRAVELNLDLAVALIGQGREEESDDAIRKAIAAEPDKEAFFLNWIAWRLILTGETVGPGVTRAVDLAKRAVELAPEEKSYWSALGIAHYRARQWQPAIDALAKAIALGNGGDAQDWLFLAMANWVNGDREEARAWYDRAAEWLDNEGTYRPELRRYRMDAAELLGIAVPQASTDQPTVEKEDE